MGWCHCSKFKQLSTGRPCECAFEAVGSIQEEPPKDGSAEVLFECGDRIVANRGRFADTNRGRWILCSLQWCIAEANLLSARAGRKRMPVLFASSTLLADG